MHSYTTVPDQSTIDGGALQPDRSASDPGPPALRAFIELVRAHEKLYSELQRFFSDHGVTMQQFNVLRILYVRDDGAGLSCHQIGERLLNRVPDITRLLDRLEKAGLVERLRSKADRRVVLTRLTAEGRALVERIHEPLIAEHERQMAHMTPEELEQLRGLLERVHDA